MTGRLAPERGRAVFGADVAGYHIARTDYPAELYAAIAGRAGHPAAIGEIGPGTGLATAAMATWEPARFVAFEPDPALAAHLAGRFPALDVVADDFVAAEVDGGFDLIAAASSFHWLDGPAALARARRLLLPGGTLAMWWNVYRQPGVGDAFAEAVLPLLAGIDWPPSESADGHYGLDEAFHRAALAAAGFVAVDYRLFRRQRDLAPGDARALYATFSMVRVLPAGQRDRLLDAIATLVQDRFAGVALSVVLTPLYLATAP